MSDAAWEERLVETKITYVLEMDGKVIVVEDVPIRLNTETGERYFAPETVEQLHRIIHSNQSPQRLIQAPVFQFAA